ncbi:hypothetical protein lerEdw1_011688 [Lerista edwardsae]|nr:hypothetical protein lerEdw1_011688 [Lerista edwardsae]
MGNQPPGGVPGTQPLLPNSMDPTRQQGHPNMGGPMQRMNPPRGMGPMGPGPQGPPGGGGPPGTPIMPSPADSTNSSDNIYTMINPVPPGGSRSNFPMGPGSDGPMGGMGGMEPHHMNGSLVSRSMWEGAEAVATRLGHYSSAVQEGSGDIDGLPKNSPNNISGISNPPGTPRDDGELGGNFLHSFQNDNVSHSYTNSSG